MASTPGPWRVNKYGSIGAGEFGTQPIVATVEPFYGADQRHGSHEDNAELIAQAPDLQRENEALKRRLAIIQAVADEQANDEGLWFRAEYITEGYFQQELRRLHEAIEGRTSEEVARALLTRDTGASHEE